MLWSALKAAIDKKDHKSNLTQSQESYSKPNAQEKDAQGSKESLLETEQQCDQLSDGSQTETE